MVGLAWRNERQKRQWSSQLWKTKGVPWGDVFSFRVKAPDADPGKRNYPFTSEPYCNRFMYCLWLKLATILNGVRRTLSILLIWLAVSSGFRVEQLTGSVLWSGSWHDRTSRHCKHCIKKALYRNTVRTFHFGLFQLHVTSLKLEGVIWCLFIWFVCISIYMWVL